MTPAVWEEWVERPVCGQARGGPRSQVFCEVTVEHHDGQPHGGRGRDGRWFFWNDPPAEEKP